jgi:hypothetical protein
MVEKGKHDGAAPVVDGAHARTLMLVVSCEDDGLKLCAGSRGSGEGADEVCALTGMQLA